MNNKSYWNQTPNNKKAFFRDIEDAIYEEDYMMSNAPCMYNLLIMRDSHDNKDFIHCILKKIFFVDDKDIPLFIDNIENRGHVVCGKYTKDVAETKLLGISRMAEKFDHRINCVMQKDY